MASFVTNKNEYSGYFQKYTKFKLSANFIRQGGEYEMEIISAYHHIAKSGRETICIIFKDLNSEKIAKTYLILSSKKGRKNHPARQFENQLLDSIFIVTNSQKELVPCEVVDYDYREDGFCVKNKIAYKDLIGKKLRIVLGYRIRAIDYFAYVSYAIGGVFEYETKQTADEILENEAPVVYFLPRETKEVEYGSYGERAEICSIRHRKH